MQLNLAAVAQVADPAGDCQAGHWPACRVVVVAVTEVRVEADRLALEPAESDLLGAGDRAGGDHDGPLDVGRESPPPIAWRACHPWIHQPRRTRCRCLADSQERARRQLDPSPSRQGNATRMASRPPPTSSDRWSLDNLRARSGRRRRSGSCRSGASRPDHRTPPAWVRVARFGGSADVRVAAQGVQDEDRVRGVFVQLAPCLVGDCDFAQMATGFQIETSRSVAPATEQRRELSPAGRVSWPPSPSDRGIDQNSAQLRRPWLLGSPSPDPRRCRRGSQGLCTAGSGPV